MVKALQIDSIKRLLPAGSQPGVVYVPGADQPSWSAITQFARAGSPVTVVCGGKAAEEFQRSAQDVPYVIVNAVSEGWLPGYSLLIIDLLVSDLLVSDEPLWPLKALRNLASGGAKPAVICFRDVAKNSEDRQEIYALLIQLKYHFAGLSGEHSLWTAAKHAASAEPAMLVNLPPEIRSLPLSKAGVVYQDYPAVPSGEILEIPVRADFEISGWAMIEPGAPPAPYLFAKARHEESGVEEYVPLPREARADVARHFGTEQLLMTGFRADLSPLCRRMGPHTVTVVQSDGINRYEGGPLFRFAIQLQEYELTARAGLANRYIRGSGIEIGALQKPLRLPASCRVRYIDRMTLPNLLEHYPEMAQHPLQAPDIIDDGQQLSHLAESSQDFAIANHFLEHCPDPIRSIHNMLRVVKPGGILYLAVPDKRHTFDLLRPVTPYAALRNAYVSGQRAGIADLFYEWAHLVHKLPPDQARERAQTLMEEDYSIHYNVWAASELLSFLIAARQDFQIPFELAAAVSSENETIVLLERIAGRLPI